MHGGPPPPTDRPCAKLWTGTCVSCCVFSSSDGAPSQHRRSAGSQCQWPPGTRSENKPNQKKIRNSCPKFLCPSTLQAFRGLVVLVAKREPPVRRRRDLPLARRLGGQRALRGALLTRRPVDLQSGDPGLPHTNANASHATDSDNCKQRPLPLRVRANAASFANSAASSSLLLRPMRASPMVNKCRSPGEEGVSLSWAHRPPPKSLPRCQKAQISPPRPPAPATHPPPPARPARPPSQLLAARACGSRRRSLTKRRASRASHPVRRRLLRKILREFPPSPHGATVHQKK